MQKCRRKLKLVDFAWYFVVLTSGFYLTALTTAPPSGPFMGKKPSPACRTVGRKGKQGQAGKLHVPAALRVPEGTKTLQSQENKNKEKKSEGIDSKRKKQKLLHICKDCQTARQNTSESCACPERLWQVLG